MVEQMRASQNRAYEGSLKTDPRYAAKLNAIALSYSPVFRPSPPGWPTEECANLQSEPQVIYRRLFLMLTGFAQMLSLEQMRCSQMTKPLPKMPASRLAAGVFSGSGFVSQVMPAHAVNPQPVALRGLAADHCTLSAANIDRESGWQRD
jgi:hypothetical protein